MQNDERNGEGENEDSHICCSTGMLEKQRPGEEDAGHDRRRYIDIPRSHCRSTVPDKQVGDEAEQATQTAYEAIFQGTVLDVLTRPAPQHAGGCSDEAGNDSTSRERRGDGAKRLSEKADGCEHKGSLAFADRRVAHQPRQM